jgi:hypothetical protein
MFDQQAHEMLYYRRIPWKQGTPPSPGHYLVTVQTDEGPPFVRLERWDGRAWVTAGGYVTVRAWDWLPEPWQNASDSTAPTYASLEIPAC